MPFTPKFVDMVRNLTTSTGTGAVTLGSAVSGFTSLSAAVTTGEQFYYCIQGVDKPAEREVGRGTMQANGTIARDAISGALTNFTPGTKTIALVTAAEWFAKIEQGGGGGGTTVAGLTDLAALPPVNGAAVLLAAKGREGLFVFSAANLSAKVTADTRQGIYVAPSAAPTGASGAWVRRFDGAINVRWFGAAGDFVTDDLPAFEAALAAINVENATVRGGRLIIPPGRYFCNGSLNLHNRVYLQGGGSGQAYGAATVIRFPPNSNGLVVNFGNTHDNGAGTQGNAEGSTIEGLTLWGGIVNVDGTGAVTGYTTNTVMTGHGVRIRAPFVALKDVQCTFWPGDGFHIDASSGAGGSVDGNANNFYLERCQALYIRGYAYWIHGNDANAGTVISCSAISCGKGGFIDYSFLGNNYFSIHVRDVGVAVDADWPCGSCTYGGLKYRVMPRQEILASTTVPGTNAAVWAPFGGQASRPWVTGKEWSIGAPFASDPDNANARNVAIGIYTEDGMLPVALFGPGILMGGLHWNVGSIGTAGEITGGRSGIATGSLIAQRPGDIKGTIFGHADGLTDESTIFSHGDGANSWKLKSDGGFVHLERTGVVLAKFAPTGIDLPAGKLFAQNGVPLRPAEWTPNFAADGVVHIAALEAMVIGQGNPVIGTGTMVYAKSTAAAPGTFGAVALPATLEAGAWLKVTASGVSGFLAAHLKRTA